ncbi:MAG: PQQ-dependent sugar dehydrogenase [Thermoanaerobaculia bacterium]
MKRVIAAAVFFTFFAALASASNLPGFRAEKVAGTSGFLTSLTFDSKGQIFYSITTGEIYRLDGEVSVELTKVPTVSLGDANLLGIAILDDDHVVAHYVSPDLTTDVLSKVDLRNGDEQWITRFPCDDGRPCSSEHHGGNPTVAPDGSIYFGIGDYGGGIRAQYVEYPAGKIYRISPEGEATQFARGVRNPYDMVWDPALQRLIVGDNGAVGDDEITIAAPDDNLGWPVISGYQAESGMVTPAYVFPETVAPTGVALLSARGAFPGGLVVASFVTHALYYFPDLAPRPLADPIPLVIGFDAPVIDVAQSPSGAIYFGTPTAIYRLDVPARGDCNGDGRIDGADLDALLHEIGDGDGTATLSAQDGSFSGSWGCDVDGNGSIDMTDFYALAKEVGKKWRGVRR